MLILGTKALRGRPAARGCLEPPRAWDCRTSFHALGSLKGVARALAISSRSCCRTARMWTISLNRRCKQSCLPCRRAEQLGAMGGPYRQWKFGCRVRKSPIVIPTCGKADSVWIPAESLL
jgi:hypothetical protein